MTAPDSLLPAVKMRLAVVVPSISRLGGGVAEAARLQVAALGDEPDIEITVLAAHDSHSDNDSLTWPKVRIVTAKVIGPTSYSFCPLLLWSLFKANPAVVHVHGVWQFHCAAVWIWSLITGRPYIVSPHGMLERWIMARSPLRKRAISALYQRNFLRRSWAFQLLTAKEKDDIANYATGQPVAVIGNYATAVTPDGISPRWWSRTLDDRKIFVFLGRIHSKKGCSELCEAWDILCTADDSFRAGAAMVFCGWIDDIHDFEDKVSTLSQKHSNVMYAGGQFGIDKMRSLAAASFFILPSKSEGLPIGVLEAWSVGTPVMMTTECNIVQAFEAGAAIKIGTSPIQIMASLKRAFEMSDSERKEIAIAAARLLEERYSASIIKNGLRTLYMRTISAKNG